MSTDPVPSPQRAPSVDIPARVIGIVIFLVGIALLGYVFWSANNLLHTPAPVVGSVPPPSPADSKTGASSSAALDLGKSLVQFGQQMLVLLLMCLVSSIIASIGVRVYFRARPSRR